MTHPNHDPPPSLSVCLDLSPSHGGLYRAVVDLAQAAGSPILSFRDGTGRLPTGDAGVPVRTVDLANASAWRRVVRLSAADARAAERAAGAPRVVVCHSIFRSHDDWVRRFCRSRATPYIAVPHGSLDPWVFRHGLAGKAAWMAAFGRPYFRAAAMVMFSTRAERTKAEKTLGFAPRSCVVPWPVEARPASPSASERQAARRRLGLPVARRILIYFGRYHSMKRPVETAQAFLRASLPDATLVMAGFDGDVAAEQLRRLSPPESDRLRIFGPLLGPQRDDLFLAADAFVSWSHRENFGYAAAEALGSAVAVILSPGNDLRGELESTACGWFPEDDSPETLARVLREFGSLPSDRLVAMGDSGRQYVQALCSRHKFAAAIREMLSALASGGEADPVPVSSHRKEGTIHP
ncbi:MAG: glycosyltransferase family 4 protein [Planctomycetota bacterium]